MKYAQYLTLDLFAPITYDPDNPFIISPSMLLTQKPYMDNLPSSVSTKEMYQSAWKHVQLLSDTFWKTLEGELSAKSSGQADMAGF